MESREQVVSRFRHRLLNLVDRAVRHGNYTRDLGDLEDFDEFVEDLYNKGVMDGDRRASERAHYIIVNLDKFRLMGFTMPPGDEKGVRP